MVNSNRGTRNRSGAIRDGLATPVDRFELSGEEKKTVPAAHYFAKTHAIGSGTETPYLARLPRARWEITRRLLAGLIQESPPSLPSCSVCPADDVAIPSAVGSFSSSSTEDRMRRWILSQPNDSPFVAVLPFPAADAVVVTPVDEIYGYDRPDLVPPAAVVTSSTIDRIEHPLRVVELIAQEDAFPDESYANWFRRYIDQSVANLAFASLAERRLARGYAGAMAGFGTPHTGPRPPNDPSVFLERLAAVRGHPAHPGGKTCLGMTSVENLLYQPEFTDEVGLKFVAIAKERSFEVSTQTRPSVTESSLVAFDGLATALEESLPPDSPKETYSVLPVHPWQFDNVVPDLRREGESETIVPIEGYTWTASPLSSFRTVSPHGTHLDEPLPRVKLPVSVFKQGHERLLLPADVHDGPQLTELLESILEGEAYERMGVLGEFAGSCYRPPDSTPDSSPEPSTTGNLSALFRTDPYSHPLVTEGRVPICAASLLADHPARDGTVARWFVERYAGAEGVSAAVDAALAFLADYVECVVPGSLRLMSQYGIGLEVHSQNTLVVFDGDARPEAALVRDFSGVRIDRSRLDPTPFDVALCSDSPVDADAREMYESYYTLFVRQLGDLIAAFVREFGADERACWNVVRDVCLETFETFRADPAIPSRRVERDADELFSETANGWALLTRRILDRRDPMYYPASNPLAGD